MFKRAAAVLSALLSAAAAAAPVVIRDLVGLVGIALIAYGAWLMYAPAGFMVAGVLLVVGVLLVSRRG